MTDNSWCCWGQFFPRTNHSCVLNMYQELDLSVDLNAASAAPEE